MSVTMTATGGGAKEIEMKQEKKIESNTKMWKQKEICFYTKQQMNNVLCTLIMGPKFVEKTQERMNDARDARDAKDVMCVFQFMFVCVCLWLARLTNRDLSLAYLNGGYKIAESVSEHHAFVSHYSISIFHLNDIPRSDIFR